MSGTRRLISGLLVVSMIAVLCGHAWAAQESAQTEPSEQSQQGQTTTQPGGAATQRQPMSSARMAPGTEEMTLVRTDQLIGKEVRNDQGERLGTIHDIVLTPDYHQVSYVALSYGGAFGIGSKLYAIPWQALNVTRTGQVTFSATRQQIEEATPFSNDNWPSQGESQWLRGESHSSTSPGQSTTSESRMSQRSSRNMAGQGMASSQEVQMRRVTHLTGMEVTNPENQDLGDIEEFAINAPTGQIEYDIISFGGIAGVGEKYAAVPANAVWLQPQNHTASLRTTKQTLESVAFSSGEFPNLSSPEYMQRLSRLFPAAPAGSALGYVPSESAEAGTGAANAEAWGPRSRHAMSFNPSSVKTITGTLESIGSFKPQNAPAGAGKGLRLRVKTSEGKTVIVYAGPRWYAEQKNFFITPGEEITVTGSESTIRSRTVILASELKKGNQTLELRDKSGKPMWPMPSQSESAAEPGQSTSSSSPSRTRE
jgi:sporulation protein YlmC with PRC-barrel domain